MSETRGFTLEIGTTGAAFHDEWSGELAPAGEIARILRVLADRLDGSEPGAQSGVLVDLNGNVTGHWRLEGEAR